MGITKLISAAGVVALCAAGACSTTDENDEGAANLFPGGGNGSAASGGASSGGGGGNNVVPSGASAGESSTGGSGEEPCVAIERESSQAVRPADIIIAIDQSGSMDKETNWVKTQLGTFANQITASGVDVHVIIIAGLPGSENGFCIPAPLGSGGCPDDNNPPTLLHIDQHVGSNDAFARILAAFPAYQPALRPAAAKHVVVITDDDSGMGAMAFNAAFLLLDPQLEDYVFHAIYSSKDDPGGFSCLLTPDPCCDVSADEGKVYRELVNFRGGVSGDLCLQDFQPVWSAVSSQIIENAPLECEWVIPEPDGDEPIDPTKVNVQLIIGGQERDLGYIADAADCGTVSDAWHYDDPNDPQRVILCPETCDEAQAATDAKINLAFDCARREADPD